MKTENNAYTYKKQLEKARKEQNIVKVLFDFLSLLSPLFIALLSLDPSLDMPLPLAFNRISTYLYYLLLLVSIFNIVLHIKNAIFIRNDVHDIYVPQFLDHIDLFSKNKYDELCKEIHHNSKKLEQDVLLYNAHGVIKDMLLHLKHLIHNITDVDLRNISVNFIYKYKGSGEHWQTIDGTSSCSIGTLDELVTKRASTYHYLYANNCEYVFFNDKASADWHIYTQYA